MQTVGVLARVDALERSGGVDVRRERQLHDVAGAVGVGVELVDRGVDVLCGRVGGQVTAYRRDPQRRAVAVLAADVGVRAGVVAEQDQCRDQACDLRR